MKKLLLLSGILSIFCSNVSATHLMGGQITCRHLGGFDYEITLTAYRDTSGVPINPTVPFHITDLFSALDTTIIASHTGMNSYYNNVEFYQYIDTFSFPSSSQFQISWQDCCRNGAILNMAAPLTEWMHCMTELMVDGSGNNSTPVFLNPPITIAQKFTNWTYNPVPYDLDGDSLAWLMETPLGEDGINVAGYTLPHADPNGPFTLNPATGELSWTPDSNGNWQASFRVEEYRNGIKIGEIRRDIQIFVMDDTSNWHHPVFGNGGWPVNGSGNFAMNLAPGSPFNLTLTVTDQDNDQLIISPQGEAMIQAVNPAQWTVVTNIQGTFTGTLNWTPSVVQERPQPYITAFRAMEFHNQSVYMTDLTLLIYVTANALVADINQNFTFGKVYPNPSSGSISVAFGLKHSSEVVIEVIDVVGQKAATILNQSMPAGNNLVRNDGLNLTSGYYFIEVKVDCQNAVTYPLIIE